MLKLKWQFVSTVVVLALLGLFLGATPPAAYAQFYTCESKANGNWSDPAIWNCGHVPTATDKVKIGHTVTLDVASVTIAYLSLDGGMFGGTLNAGSSTINLNIFSNNNSNSTFNAGTSTVNFNGTNSGFYISSRSPFYKMNIVNGGRTITF